MWRLIPHLSFFLIISQQALGVEVEVYEGAESVLLPCQVPQNVSSSSTAAVWDREELNVPTVHVRLLTGDDNTYQNHRYTNRTSMRADALQTGDLSLTLRNPAVSDSGTYTCTTRKDGEDQNKSHLQLKVTGYGSSLTSFLHASIVLCCECVCVCVCGCARAFWSLCRECQLLFFLYVSCSHQNDHHNQFASGGCHSTNDRLVMDAPLPQYRGAPSEYLLCFNP
uniref:Ig-like domain-containing protein n=1 Tax=Amphilophus citrinellus TaxID=61819 RepID=A0A3Q0QSB3_AMPCI